MKMLLPLPWTLEISLENRKKQEKRLETANKALSIISSLKNSRETLVGEEIGILQVDKMDEGAAPSRWPNRNVGVSEYI